MSCGGGCGAPIYFTAVRPRQGSHCLRGERGLLPTFHFIVGAQDS